MAAMISSISTDSGLRKLEDNAKKGTSAASRTPLPPRQEFAVPYLYGVSLLAATLLQPRSGFSARAFWALAALCANAFAQKTGSNELQQFRSTTALKQDRTGLLSGPTPGVNNGKKMLPAGSRSSFDRLEKMQALVSDWIVYYLHHWGEKYRSVRHERVSCIKVKTNV